jgi:type IV secretion system protein VirD4
MNSAPSSLLLGWQSHQARTLGFFAPQKSVGARPSPLTYTGEGHLLTVAPTGTGKGRCVIIPTLLSYTGPIIVIDPKGEAAQVTSRYRRLIGHKVVVLDPFHLVTDKSDRLNPFDLFDLDHADAESDSEMIASMLAVGHEFTTDPYWTDTGVGLTAGLIAHIGLSEKAEKRTLAGLRKLLHHDDLDYHLACQLDAKSVNSPLARDEFVSYLSAPSDKTRPCIRTTACTYVKALGSAAVADSLGPSSFSLRDLAAGMPMTIYLVIPPDKLTSHRGLLRLWIGTLLTAVMRRRQIPRQRTLFMLDECSALGTLDSLRQAITLLRGSGLQVWTFWQDLSQLKLRYPLDWATMLNNSAILQGFGFNNHQIARDWADLTGMPVNEIARLEPEDCALSLHREGRRVCRRLDYLRDEMFQDRFDANERYALLPGAQIATEKVRTSMKESRL